MLAIRAKWAFDGERAVPGGATVLVDSGRILGVEAWGAPTPAGCTVMDYTDATLLPGLINTHVHLCGDSGPNALERLPDFSDELVESVIDVALDQQLAAGVTTVRDLGCRRWVVVDRRDEDDGLGGRPEILASGPPITSVGGHCWPMGGEAAGIEALRSAVADRAERRVDVVKVMASGGYMTPGTDPSTCQFTLDELRVVVDEAHRQGLPVTAHAHGLAAVEMAIQAGVDGIEHCSCLGTGGHVMSDDVLRGLRDGGIAVCPTLGRHPDIVTPPEILERLARSGLTPEARRDMFRRAHAAGVKIVSGDDTGIAPGKVHGIFAEAIIDLQTAGIAPADALASATSVAAEACGVGGRKGRLRAGFDADLTIVSGDATRDVTALRSVAGVVTRGRVSVI